MEILSVNTYLDGGTIRITVKNNDDSYDQSDYCIDGRISTRTRNSIFLGYPTNSFNDIVRDEFLIWELLTLLSEYDNGVYQSLANELSGGGKPYDKLKSHSIKNRIKYRTL